MHEFRKAQAELDRDGFTILKSVVSEISIQQLIEAVESLRATTTAPEVGLASVELILERVVYGASMSRDLGVD